ncbi:MAG TPA: LLM class flavin-dependent oxidoreductase [Jatrophihabitantaceae bacterium]|jgi:alkanesulfonate monooxygenase SsuD/methylene tetrahydromethanopterin reductase-like flavin-dependent oxidoreductase (luciferase family)
MQLGIGLPNVIPGTPGPLLVDWARQAEERGFAGLATIDRIVYPSYDSLTTLAAVAGATTRIGLLTNILLAPAYQPVLLAKVAASIDQLSGARLTLGLGVGTRPDDYAAVERDFHRRGRDFDEALDVLHRAWRGERVGDGALPVGPTPTNDQRVPILIGGNGDHALKRLRTYGDGWTAGGAAPAQAAPFVEQVRATWSDAGRPGSPRIAALNYFSLGEEAETDSRAYLRHYYGTAAGPELGEAVANSALRTPQAIRDTVRQFEDAGFTEVYLDPTVASLEQIDRLADVVL